MDRKLVQETRGENNILQQVHTDSEALHIHTSGYRKDEHHKILGVHFYRIFDVEQHTDVRWTKAGGKLAADTKVFSKNRPGAYNNNSCRSGLLCVEGL